MNRLRNLMCRRFGHKIVETPGCDVCVRCRMQWQKGFEITVTGIHGLEEHLAELEKARQVIEKELMRIDEED